MGLYDEESERFALAIILNNPGIFTTFDESSFSQVFFTGNRFHLASTVKLILSDGLMPDITTVDAYLKRNMPDLYDSWGGMGRLQHLMLDMPYGDTSFDQILDRLRECHRRRELKRIASSLETLALNDHIQLIDSIGATQEELNSLLTNSNTVNTFYDLNEAQEIFLESLENRISIPEGTFLGIPSGYRALDEALSGLQPGNLVILAARPAMGKSSVALEVAAHAAIDHNRPTVFFSFEMSTEELMQRLISLRSFVPHKKIKQGNLSENDWAKISKAWIEIKDAPLYIEENPNTTISDMIYKCSRVSARHGGIGLIVVDYIQLMGSTTRQNRQEEVSEISRKLKILAKDFGAPVLALSQLNRALESRGNKRPMLHDLRESGSLEQDSDIVLFLYRDEIYYNTTADQGIAEIIIAKNRHGDRATIRLGFLNQYTSFKDLAKN